MLELRLSTDAKRIAAMRDAVARECERSKAGPEHAAAVAIVLEQLVGPPETGRAVRNPFRARSGGEVLVLVTVQSDATMLMVRDPRAERDGLGERRRRVLEEHTSRWSTMSGRDGRTVWAEVARAVAPADPRREPVAPARALPEVDDVAVQALTPAPARTEAPVTTNA